jgi:hypothetical protein
MVPQGRKSRSGRQTPNNFRRRCAPSSGGSERKRPRGKAALRCVGGTRETWQAGGGTRQAGGGRREAGEARGGTARAPRQARRDRQTVREIWRQARRRREGRARAKGRAEGSAKEEGGLNGEGGGDGEGEGESGGRRQNERAARTTAPRWRARPRTPPRSAASRPRGHPRRETATRAQIGRARARSA